MTLESCLRSRLHLPGFENLIGAKTTGRPLRQVPGQPQGFPGHLPKIIQTVVFMMKTLGLCLRQKQHLRRVANDHLAAIIPFPQWDTRASMDLRDQCNLDIQWHSFTLPQLPCSMKILVSCRKQIPLLLQVRN